MVLEQGCPQVPGQPWPRPSSHAKFRQQKWGVWVETRRTSWRKCHCRQRTWSSQREDKEQTLEEMGMSLVAQWLRICTPNGGGQGSIPGQGTRSHMP